MPHEFPAIQTQALKKSFGQRPVLTGLDLSVEPGEVTLMVGANGVGKTTALRLLAGLAEPDAGTISIAGYDLRRERRSALARLSFLPQAPRFHPRLTVAQVVDFYGCLRGRPKDAAAATIGRWGLLDCAAVPTGKLSGGLRQRLALAVFDLADTPVRLLDEPGLSLDPEWRARLQSFLLTEAQRGRAVLVATHLLGEWENHVTRCVLIEHGRCARELSPRHLREAFFGAERGPGRTNEPTAMVAAPELLP